MIKRKNEEIKNQETNLNYNNNKSNLNSKQFSNFKTQKSIKILVSSISIALIAIVISVIFIMKNRNHRRDKFLEQGGAQEIVEDIGAIQALKKEQANPTYGVQYAKDTIDTSNWDLDRVKIVEDTEGHPVPVPIGYSASKVKDESGNYLERTIDNGFVIYEGEEEPEGTYTVSNNVATMDGTVKTAQSTRNQYVWIPVYDSSTLYGKDASGKLWGKLYDYTSSGRTANNWKETDGIFSLNSLSSFREPDVIGEYLNSWEYDKDSYMKDYIPEEERKQINKEMERDFTRLVQSIEKYGGFYVGRYETGGLNKKKANVVKGDTNISNVSWYKMYNKCKNLRGESSNIETHMIYGSQWDRILEWYVESGSKTYSDLSDSYSWGNHYNSSFKYTSSSGTVTTKYSNYNVIIPSGSTEYTKANNIYDIAGNVWDYTLEAYSSFGRMIRGGYSYQYAYVYPARERYHYYPYYSYSYFGVRAALYISM